MKQLFTTGLLALLITLGVGLTTTSCYKDPIYKARIVVQDTLGERLEDASVRIYAPINDNQVDETDSTDASGTVEFTFELDAVLDIDVTYGTWTGSGFVQLEPNETVEEVIIVRP